MGCRDEPITCRKKIAAKFGLTPNEKKSWQFGGRCPNCGHGGFSISAPDQAHVVLRHIWWCNCHRCRCKPEVVRDAMEDAGVTEACLGTYARKPAARKGDGAAGDLRDAMAEVLADSEIRALADLKLRMAEVLADSEIRALADLKLRMAEVLWGAAPSDWDGFVAFAGRAGVSRSKRYEAAARWGRRQRQ